VNGTYVTILSNTFQASFLQLYQYRANEHSLNLTGISLPDGFHCRWGPKIHPLTGIQPHQMFVGSVNPVPCLSFSQRI